MKPTVVYILGLGHSGTTILQYLLACGRGTLGLGEVRKLVDGGVWEDAGTACSCGAHAGDCPLWSGLQPEAGQADTDWYRRTADALSHRYPDATHWIDTSKTPGGLRAWQELRREGEIGDIRVLFLVRDLRGWVCSDEKARRRKDRRKRPLLMPILSWWRGQAHLEQFLSTSGLDYRVVSYERLIFQTRAAMDAIADFTGIEDLGRNWETKLGEAEVHDVLGNRVKNDPERRTRLAYDDDWQYRAGLNLLSLMIWPAWRMNARLRRRAPQEQP